MAMPCSHPDLFIDDWLDLVWSNGRGDEFDISFGDYEEEVWNMAYCLDGYSPNKVNDAR